VRLNGTEVSTQNTGTQSLSGLKLMGFSGNNTSNMFDGLVPEQFVIAGAPSSDELTSIENYAGEKYKLKYWVDAQSGLTFDPINLHPYIWYDAETNTYLTFDGDNDVIKWDDRSGNNYFAEGAFSTAKYDATNKVVHGGTSANYLLTSLSDRVNNHDTVLTIVTYAQRRSSFTSTDVNIVGMSSYTRNDTFTTLQMTNGGSGTAYKSEFRQQRLTNLVEVQGNDMPLDDEFVFSVARTTTDTNRDLKVDGVTKNNTTNVDYSEQYNRLGIGGVQLNQDSYNSEYAFRYVFVFTDDVSDADLAQLRTWCERNGDAKNLFLDYQPMVYLEPHDATTITQVSNRVSQIDDKSGLDNHFVQASGGSQPETNVDTLNGLNVFDFQNDSLDSGTVDADDFQIGDDWTIFYVYDVLQATTNNEFMSVLSYVDNDGNDWQLDAGNTTAYLPRFNSDITTNITPSYAVRHDPVILTLRFDKNGDAQAEIFHNGVSLGTGAAPAAFTFGGTMRVGTNRNGLLGLAHNGGIFLFYPYAMSNAEMNAVGGRLNEIYGDGGSNNISWTDIT
jgi:hypothetical protein